MAKNLLHEVVSGAWADPDTGKNVTLPAREIVIGPDVTAKAAEYLEKFRPQTFLLIADETTYKIQGREIESVMKKNGNGGSSMVFPNGVKPTEINAEKIKTQAADADLIIAVGSGTINDLCKYAAFLRQIPYVVFASAPSMNGYASANASIITGKYKKTLPAQMAAGIYLDLDILSRAPLLLIRSGVGDLACRQTAEADWLLSHLLLGTEYKTAPFALLATSETELSRAAPGLLKGDMEAMRILAEGLILSGIGMYICGSSAPASQGEHLIAHYMEMLHPELPETFHGEQIGVTTLTMLDIQRELLGKKIIAGDYIVDEQKIINQLGREIGSQAIVQVKNKAAAYNNSRALEKINDDWKNISRRIIPLLAGSEKIRDILESIGAPVKPEDLGWPDKYYREAVKNALLLRNRFTFLDVVHIMRKKR